MEAKPEPSQGWSTCIADQVGVIPKTEASIAAFTIQAWWRQRAILNALKKKLQANAKKLIVFTSTISADGGVGLRTKSVLNACETAGLKPIIVDLSTCSYRRKEIPLYNFKLPVVMIGTHCIGEEPDLLSIASSDLLADIVEEEYLRRCLLCKGKRDSHEKYHCEECGEPYTFFHRSF